MHLHVPDLLAAVGGGETRTVGTRNAGGVLHGTRLPFLLERDVGLRIPTAVRAVVPQAQGGKPYLLSGRHPNAGELQQMAHDIRGKTHVAVPEPGLDMPQQSRHLQRLHPVRLAHDRHLDGKRTVRLGLQPALRPLLSGGRTARKAARGESFHLGCPGESGTLPRHRPRHLGQDDMPCERCELHRHLRFEQRRGPLSGQTTAGPYVGELHVFPALHPAGQDAQQLPAQTFGQHQLLAHARRRTAR